MASRGGPAPSFYPCHHLNGRSPFLKVTLDTDLYPDTDLFKQAHLLEACALLRDCSLNPFAEGYVFKNTHQVLSGTGPLPWLVAVGLHQLV